VSLLEEIIKKAENENIEKTNRWEEECPPGFFDGRLYPCDGCSGVRLGWCATCTAK